MNKYTMKQALFGIFIILLTFTFAGCATIVTHSGDKDDSASIDTSLESFDSLSSFYDYLGKHDLSSQFDYNSNDFARLTSSVAVIGSAESVAAPTAQSESKGDLSSYSETNVQIEGVDEADFIKTNGDYIFVGKNSMIFVVDAVSLKIVSQIDVSGEESSWNYNVPQLFLDGDMIYVLVTQYDESLYFSPYSLYVGTQREPKTLALMYNISDASSPELQEKITLAGEYNDARLSSDTLIISSRQYLNRDPGYPISEPFVRSDDVTFSSRIIYDPRGAEPNMLYNVATINTVDFSVQDSVSLASSYDTTLMVSEENIYLAYHTSAYQYRFGDDYEQYQWERFVSVMVPELPSSLRRDVLDIIDEQNGEIPDWNTINDAFVAYYGEMTPQEIHESLDNAFAALEKYDVDLQKEYAKTYIYKISYVNGSLEEVGVGSASGRLLNQFSLDEYDGNLRVATTFDVWSSGRVTYNNVFVFDENMNLVGELTGIAEDEQIYSARFMGDSLYLVTYRQVDPLFVIDLSDTTNPSVSGELKIPGFSSYLHPIGDGLVISVGRDGDDNGRVEGVQVSLFDVSDPSSPKRLDGISFGGQYSNSAALNDHHAFTFDADKRLLIIPVTERDIVYEPDYSSSSRFTAQVISVSSDSLTSVGEIVHFTQESNRYYYDYDVLRSLYIGDVLYTLSSSELVASSYSDFSEIGSVKFPEPKYDEPEYYGYPTPIEG